MNTLGRNEYKSQLPHYTEHKKRNSLIKKEDFESFFAYQIVKLLYYLWDPKPTTVET